MLLRDHDADLSRVMKVRPAMLPARSPPPLQIRHSECDRKVSNINSGRYPFPIDDPHTTSSNSLAMDRIKQTFAQCKREGRVHRNRHESITSTANNMAVGLGDVRDGGLPNR